MEIERLGPKDVDRVVASSAFFDEPATGEWTTTFLTAPGHHLLFASLDGVDPSARGQGAGRALVTALGDLAIELGCYGMWVSTESDDEAALATYRSAGAGDPEPGVVLTWTFELA